MNSLQPPFSDIVGESSPVQKAIKMIWEIFANHPLPNNKSIASQSAAEQIVLHLLGTMNSIGMINAAGYHSAAVTLMRSIEDALDCLFAVVQSDINANKWLNGELKASQAARTWTADKVVDQSIPLGDYRKNIRHGLNMNEARFSNIFIEKRASSCPQSLEKSRLFSYPLLMSEGENSQNVKRIFLRKVVI